MVVDVRTSRWGRTCATNLRLVPGRRAIAAPCGDLRKLSFGTQSAAGSRFVETMLTVIETCRQQGRNVAW